MTQPNGVPEAVEAVQSAANVEGRPAEAGHYKLSALRRRLPAGRKVLIVLDQFEQWLHPMRDREHTELVQALRHCDGGRVQCLVLVYAAGV